VRKLRLARAEIDASIADFTLIEVDALIKVATARRETLFSRGADEVKTKAASLGMSLMDLVG
jgi:hypothetical protein